MRWFGEAWHESQPNTESIDWRKHSSTCKISWFNSVTFCLTSLEHSPISFTRFTETCICKSIASLRSIGNLNEKERKLPEYNLLRIGQRNGIQVITFYRTRTTLYPWHREVCPHCLAVAGLNTCGFVGTSCSMNLQQLMQDSYKQWHPTSVLPCYMRGPEKRDHSQ